VSDIHPAIEGAIIRQRRELEVAQFEEGIRRQLKAGAREARGNLQRYGVDIDAPAERAAIAAVVECLTAPGVANHRDHWLRFLSAAVIEAHDLSQRRVLTDG
jgi:hypothetical protein